MGPIGIRRPRFGLRGIFRPRLGLLRLCGPRLGLLGLLNPAHGVTPLTLMVIGPLLNDECWPSRLRLSKADDSPSAQT